VLFIGVGEKMDDLLDFDPTLSSRHCAGLKADWLHVSGRALASSSVDDTGWM
jgi:hypothetical protein